jgi:hypothetical protein
MLIKCNAADHLYLIKDDPVRPDLFENNRKRFEAPFHVYAEVNDETGEIAAVVCVVSMQVRTARRGADKSSCSG